MKTILALAAATAFVAVPGASHAAVYADVVSSVPVVGSVSVPRESCGTVEQVVQPRSSGAGALLGAVAGGLLGNTVGRGGTRFAATGIGAVAGAAIGDQIEGGNRAAYAVPVQRCQTVRSVENRTVGYDVTYEYAGQRHTTRLPYDPGARLALDIRPAGAGPASGDNWERRPGAAAPAERWERMQGAPVPSRYADVEPLQPYESYDATPTYPAYEQAPQRIVYAAPPVVGYPIYAPPAISLSIGYGSRGYYHSRGPRHRHWR